MQLTIQRSSALHGEITLPGDKSISHRAALFAALAQGESRIENFLVSGVTGAMLRSLTALGVHWGLDGTTLSVAGRGVEGLVPPEGALDCGNSATTMRMLAGALAAAGTAAVLDGTPSLRRRPMDRIITPLQAMGVPIQACPQGTAPLALQARPVGQALRALYYELPVASAQVKTCLLLAALAADGPTTLVEPSLSRDHTERMLASMGVALRSGQVDGRPSVTLSPAEAIDLAPLRMTIPGDFSAAAFLIVAALVAPGSEVVLRGVGLNPTRTGLLASLWEMGAEIKVENERVYAGETLGDLRVRAGSLQGVSVSGGRVVDMIDEFPAFAVAAAFARGRTEVSQAEELRFKESDRIGSLCAELRKLGVQVEEHRDGFVIEGTGEVPGGAQVDPNGDHRLAMALAVAGFGAENPVTVLEAGIMSESFPEFTTAMGQLGAGLEVEGGQ
jgi:3-phosphoshikimate 1-carboxyvinyltransferase